MIGRFQGPCGKCAEGFEGIHGGYEIGKKNAEGRLVLDFCDQKELYVANTWFKKKDKREVTYSSGGNDSEIYFVLVGKEKRKYLRDVKIIPGELQHRLVVVGVEEQKLKKSVKKSKRVRWRVWKPKEKKIKEKFKERIEKLVDIDSKDLWGSYKNGVLKESDELCEKTKARGDWGNTWWWNEQVMDAIDRKKKAFTLWCTNRSAENKSKYRKARNETKIVIAKVMRKEAEEEMNALCTKPNDFFKFVKFIRKEGRGIDGGGIMKDKDGRLVVSEKDRGELWKEHMEKIMNMENEWDQMVEIDMVEGPVEGVTDEEVMEAMNTMKLGKAAGPSEVNMDMIIASGTFGVGVMKKLCQKVLMEKVCQKNGKQALLFQSLK